MTSITNTSHWTHCLGRVHTSLYDRCNILVLSTDAERERGFYCAKKSFRSNLQITWFAVGLSQTGVHRFLPPTGRRTARPCVIFPRLVKMLADMAIGDLALTTNGILLAETAASLRSAISSVYTTLGERSLPEDFPLHASSKESPRLSEPDSRHP